MVLYENLLRFLPIQQEILSMTSPITLSAFIPQSHDAIALSLSSTHIMTDVTKNLIMAAPVTTKASLAKEIRAIMDSTPDGLETRQIEKDYRDLIGKSLREKVRGVGFNDVESFLMALSDEGYVKLDKYAGGGFMFRAGEADSSTKHIQDMVKKQQSKGSRRNRRSGSSRMGSRSTPHKPPQRKELPKATQENILKLLRQQSRGEMNLSNLIKLYHSKYGVNLNYRTSGFSSLRAAVSCVDGIEMRVSGDSVSIYHKPIEPLMSSPTYDEVRQKLCENLTKVLGDDSVKLTEFGERYRTRTGYILSPAKYGFGSLLELLNDLVEVVNLERENQMGDWTITHISKAKKKETTDTQKRIPLELIKLLRHVVRGNPSGIYLANFDQTFKLETRLDLNPRTYGYDMMQSLLCDALKEELEGGECEIISAKFGQMIRVRPKENTTPQRPLTHTPDDMAIAPASLELHDAVGPGVQYNRLVQPPVNPHRFIEIIVSQVYNPGNFYIQIMANDNTGKRLEELMDRLEDAYSRHEATRSYLLPSMFAVPGQVAVCRFPNDQNWHRARITKVIDANFVQVIFVDYGTSCAIHKGQLYYLRQKFLQLPPQAQPASLFGIEPVGSDKWSASAARVLLNLTADKNVCALVIDADRDQRLALCLTDTSGSIDVHINDYLVTSNFATFSDTAKHVPTQNLAQADQAVEWEISSDEEDDVIVTSNSRSEQPLTAPPEQLNITTNGAMTAQSAITQAFRRDGHSTLPPPPLEKITTPSRSSVQPPDAKADVLPPLERCKVDSVTSQVNNLVINEADDQMPSLELIKKCVVNPSINSNVSRNQQTATVKPHRQPGSVMGMPPLQTVPRPPPPQQYYTNSSQSQPPPHQMMIQQPMFVQQPNPYQHHPMFYNQQYAVYRQPYPQQYIHHHPHLLQPNVFYNSQTLYQPSIPNNRPQYNTQQANHSQPPPLIPAQHAPQQSQTNKSQNGSQTMPQIVEEDGPPPLIPDSQSQDTVRINCVQITQLPQTQSMTIAQLKYKLNGLQLKHKRLLRERYAHESADFSGAESSDSDENISMIDAEIKHCKQQLEQLVGGAGDNGLKSPTMPLIGRGRGKAHLMAIMNDD